MKNEILNKLERLQEYAKILQNDLGDFDEFAKYIARYLEKEEE